MTFNEDTAGMDGRALALTDHVIISVTAVLAGIKEHEEKGTMLDDPLIITQASLLKQLPVESSSIDAIVFVLRTGKLPVQELLEEMFRILKQDKAVTFQMSQPATENVDVIVSTLKRSLLIAGFSDVKVDEKPLVMPGDEKSFTVRATKPSWKIGSSFSIKKSTKSLPKLQIDDDMDVIDEDSLLTEEDLKKPEMPLVGDCEVGSTKKACKNCTCGRAEAEEKIEKLGLTMDQINNPQSACGSEFAVENVEPISALSPIIRDVERQLDDENDSHVHRINENEPFLVCDQTGLFANDQSFDDPDELITWCKNVGKSCGTVIITSRSDKKQRKTPRFTLACDRSGPYRPGKRVVIAPGSKSIPRPKRIGTKKCDCPFKLKLYQNEDLKWKLVVICGEHNHPVNDNLVGVTYPARLKPVEQDTVNEMSDAGAMPKIDPPVAVEDNYFEWYRRVSHPLVAPTFVPVSNDDFWLAGVSQCHSILKNTLTLDVVKNVGHALTAEIKKAIKALTDIPCYKPQDAEPEPQGQLTIRELGEGGERRAVEGEEGQVQKKRKDKGKAQTSEPATETYKKKKKTN